MKPSEYNSVNSSRFPFTKREHFSVRTAYREGYYSKSEWLRRGRESVEDAEPVLAVAKSWETHRPQMDGYYPEIVLAHGDFRYLVTSERFDAESGRKCCWPVYSYSQTRPKQKKPRQRNAVGPRAADCGFVILDETPPSEVSFVTSSSISSSPSSSLLLHILPIDDRESGQIAATPSPTNDLLVNNRQQKSSEALNNELKNDKPSDPIEGFVILDEPNASKPQSTDPKPRLRPAKGRRVEYRGLIPTEFGEADWDKIKGLEEEFAVFCWRLVWFRVIKSQEADDWIDMAYDWCRVNIPKWPTLKRLLIAQGIVERTPILETDIGGIPHIFPRGKELGRAFGYRFRNPAYRRKHHTVELTKPSVTKYLSASKSQSPVLRWLEQNLRRLQVVDWDDEYLLRLAEASWEKEREGTVQGRLERYRTTLQWLRGNNWIFEPDDFSGRIHSNLTALKRETRKYLRVDGNSLAQCDLPNSQPMFLALACRDTKYHDPHFLNLCCKGELYEHLADLGGWSREEVKNQFTRKALFAPNNSSYQRLPVKLRFDQGFPRIADYMRRQKYGRPTKDNPKPHNRLARRLQREEIKLITAVCDQIRKERPEMFVGTIHDSVCFEVHNGDFVRAVMEDELDRIGLRMELNVEPFS